MLCLQEHSGSSRMELERGPKEICQVYFLLHVVFVLLVLFVVVDFVELNHAFQPLGSSFEKVLKWSFSLRCLGDLFLNSGHLVVIYR